MRYDANKKSALIAYVLWFFLGYLGAHRFYLGHTGTGVAILLLTIASAVLAFVVIGLFLIIIPAIWVLVDAFLIPGMVTRANNELITRLQR
jgi:TM2 domain-containing membrane protein YozV